MPASAFAQNPGTGSVVINGGDVATNSTDVTLTITNPTGINGTLYYQVYSPPTAAPLNSGAWTAAGSQFPGDAADDAGVWELPFTLAAPDGAKTVYVRFSDTGPPGTGTMDTWVQAVSDSINLVTVAPTTTAASTDFVSPGGPNAPVVATDEPSFLFTVAAQGWYSSPPDADGADGYVQYTEYSLDGGSWTDAARWPMAWPVGANLAKAQSFVEFSDLADGAHTLLYRSVDHWNNVEATNELDFIVDTTAPSTSTYATLSSGATADLSKWYSRDVTVHFQAHDPGFPDCSTVYAINYKVDSGAWQQQLIPVTPPPLQDPAEAQYTITAVGCGIHTVSYYAEDWAGNTESTKTIQVKIDKVAPSVDGVPVEQGFTADEYYDIGIASPPTEGESNDLWHNHPVTVTFTGNDDNGGAGSGISSIEYRIDGGAWTSGDSVTLPTPADGSNDGKHLVEARAYDNALTVHNVTAPADYYSVEVWIDASAPQTTFTGSAPDATNGPAFDQTKWYNDDVNLVFNGLDPNYNKATGHLPWPNPVSPDWLPNSSGMNYTEYRVDGGDWVQGNSVTIPAFPRNDGVHTVDYRSVDNAGVHWIWAAGLHDPQPVDYNNVETFHTVTVNIDTQRPTTTGAAGWWNPAFPYTLTAVDQPVGGSGVAGTEYRVDNGVWALYPAAGITLTGATGAQHTVDYYSWDNAGNNEHNFYFDHSTVTLDATAPVTTVSGADDAWHNGPVSLSFAASDVGAGVDYTEYSIDGGTTWTMANNVVITAPGVTHVMYRSVDLAQPSGNVEAAKTVDVKIDTAAPVTTDDYDGMWHNSDVTITLTATGGAGGVAYTEYQIAGGAWTHGTTVVVPADANEGVVPVQYRSVSNAGDVEATHTVDVKIDTVGPVVSSKLKLTIKQNHLGRLTYRVSDMTPTAMVTITIVKKGGTTVKTINVGSVSTNAGLRRSIKASFKKGKYVIKIMATDEAGNAQSQTGRTHLTVK